MKCLEKTNLSIGTENGGRSPATTYSDSLIQMGILNSDNNINVKYFKENDIDPNIPFLEHGGYSTIHLRHHFFDLLLECIQKMELNDLDHLLKKKYIQDGSLINKLCFYVGGLYGHSPKLPITKATPPTHLYFRRKPYFVEWDINSLFLCSTTATIRLGSRSIYAIYGIIRNIGKITKDGTEFIHIKIRPLAFGSPKITKDRTPNIHYYKNNFADFDYPDEDYDES
ncbi:hypothetical protein LEP1GSC202_0399 [Leptospira yanagawae serovar Saopaulo str. Sao Paulo = ATCC 700523]|uniref:Uncharacterized protein n=1 Tax=Leptospira yanagawae serovar Saopaulo str. Sao Paulo = ATCC 700523 TaxID=1249483 RepID=A0A5E8HGV8_9LEPT|nr:hypothetical protein [Leptospira yanagawae]EOQ90077.1 hypothetical protein LEP1GSC202_0399 [Leptospira yanagawae serovar Saopaulo str. Sao Paulo = ATCC 700523]